MSRLILLAGLALMSCTNPDEPLAADTGNSVRQNIAAQVVNPFPPVAGETYTDGLRMDAAATRYRTNRTYQPRLPLAGTRDENQAQQQQ